MNEPFKVSRATAVVDVAAVSPGDSPTIRVVYHAENSRGIARQLVRQIPVRDAALFGRIQADVKEGEQIEATTVNEWYDTGYVSYLVDFKKVSDVEQETTVKNGVLDIGHHDITEIIMTPNKTKDESTMIEEKRMSDTKRVWLFEEGNAAMRDELGGKGANLAEMSSIGL